jgi:CheY-like chemotaxis protein
MPPPPRILVLEDDPLIAMMLGGWLEELRCETVGPANTVPEAIRLIRGASLDGAVLDISLDDQDCIPAADLLRQKGIPFAFATGHSVDGLPASHANALSLPKPYDFAAFREVLCELLGSSRVDHPEGRGSTPP